MQRGCKNQNKRCMCDDCDYITDSIECYEFRDLHRTRTDINDDMPPEHITDERVNEILEWMLNYLALKDEDS